MNDTLTQRTLPDRKPGLRMSARWCQTSPCATVRFLPLFFFALFFVFWTQAAAIAKGKPPSYPNKGRVVAVRVDEHTDYAPIFPTDSKGRTHGGEAFTHRKQVYRVETDDRIYEFAGGKDPLLAVGDAVEFRIEKETVHVRAGEKDKKYRIVSTTSKSNSRISRISETASWSKIPGFRLVQKCECPISDGASDGRE